VVYGCSYNKSGGSSAARHSVVNWHTYTAIEIYLATHNKMPSSVISIWTMETPSKDDTSR